MPELGIRARWMVEVEPVAAAYGGVACLGALPEWTRSSRQPDEGRGVRRKSCCQSCCEPTNTGGRCGCSTPRELEAPMGCEGGRRARLGMGEATLRRRGRLLASCTSDGLVTAGSDLTAAWEQRERALKASPRPCQGKAWAGDRHEVWHGCVLSSADVDVWCISG